MCGDAPERKQLLDYALVTKVAGEGERRLLVIPDEVDVGPGLQCKVGHRVRPVANRCPVR